MPQIAISFDHPADYSRHSFIVSRSNEEALKWVESWPNWNSHCVIIYGPESCGKTHLAKIWQDISAAEFCHPAGARSAILRGQNLIIENIESNLDEEWLFHLYNQAKNDGKFILLTANAHPAKLPIKLPDLRSRLLSCPSIAINQPDDDLLRPVLQKLFTDRQIRAGDDVMKYILLRMERSFKSAENLVQKIDNLALQEKRNITIPLVKQAMEI